MPYRCVRAPDGSYSGDAYIVCSDSNPQEQFKAVVYDTPMVSLPINGATC